MYYLSVEGVKKYFRILSQKRGEILEHEQKAQTDEKKGGRE